MKGTSEKDRVWNIKIIYTASLQHVLTKFQFSNWKNDLGLLFPWLKWPNSWSKCYYFKLLGSKIQPYISCSGVSKLCSGVEISSEPTREELWGWVLNPRTFWCSGVYGTPLVVIQIRTFYWCSLTLSTIDEAPWVINIPRWQIAYSWNMSRQLPLQTTRQINKLLDINFASLPNVMVWYASL